MLSTRWDLRTLVLQTAPRSALGGTQAMLCHEESGLIEPYELADLGLNIPAVVLCYQSTSCP